MDTEDPRYDQFRDILERENALTGRIAAIQGEVKQAVLGREWADFEAQIAALAEAGEEFEELEAARVEIFGEGEAGFYAQCARFPEEERRVLTELYRRLKTETIKVRLENDGLSKYIAETRLVISGALDILYPERRGRLYSRRGMQVQPDMSSMMLNQCL